MRIIHCTKKLLQELDVNILEPDDIPSNPEGLGNWYANLIRIDRRKCILFTNEKTLYSFLIPKVLKSNLKNIEEEFLINLNLNLQAEGFNIEVISRVMQEYGEIGFAKTANKSVLGSMNDLAYLYAVHIIEDGGFDNIKMLQLNQRMNRTPMGAMKYQFSIEVLKNLLQGVS